MQRTIDVFISYALADEARCSELEVHLAVLKGDGVIRAWHAGNVAAGEDWRRRIEERLAAARVVVALVSADYLANDYLYKYEMTPALERAKLGAVLLLPVIVRAFDWQDNLFQGITPLPHDRRPVMSWPDKDEAWCDVARGIREAIERLDGGPQTRSVQPAKSPLPRYENEESRSLLKRLDEARARRKALLNAAASTKEVDREIIELRRALREGGRLHAGDALQGERYLLLERIGQGGFASVWSAHDRERGERVAVKVLHTELARDPQRCERFFRGARVMASLGHETIVRVLNPRGEDGGYLYFVMELVPGDDLHRAVVNGRVPHERVVPILLDVGEALAEAHAKGFVHRDVKPANVLLDASGMPRLTDFDLVAADDTTGGTRTGALGTMLFTAPEQLNNAKEADARADVYGLGMTALFCLYGGRLPQDTVRRPDKVIEQMSCGNALKQVLMRTIEINPNDRYANARAFCDALRAAAEVAPPERSPQGSEAMLLDTRPPVRNIDPAEMLKTPSRVPSPPVSPAWRRPPRQGYLLDVERKDLDGRVQDERRRKTRILRIGGITLGATLTAIFSVAVLPRLQKSSSDMRHAGQAAVPTSTGGPSPAAVATTPDVTARVADTATAVVTAATAVVTAATQELPQTPRPCSIGMALIVGGTFQMGEGSDQHQETVATFCMDKTEVTVAAYHACFDKHECTEPLGGCTKKKCEPMDDGWGCNWRVSGREQHPINCVDWNQAKTFCESIGKRLPLEKEWEYAARGPEGRTYPWGDREPTTQLCWGGPGSDLFKGRDSTCKVGKYPAGNTPQGLQDMGGNVFEWTEDRYCRYDEKNCTNAARVFRGGCWLFDQPPHVRGTFRGAHPPAERTQIVGFRCVQSR